MKLLGLLPMFLAIIYCLMCGPILGTPMKFDSVEECICTGIALLMASVGIAIFALAKGEG